MSRLPYGPRRATYFVTLVDSGSVTQCRDLPAAESERAYWTAEGRATSLALWEQCVVPGCDSAGTVSLPKPRASRGVRYATRECRVCRVFPPSEIRRVADVSE